MTKPEYYPTTGVIGFLLVAWLVLLTVIVGKRGHKYGAAGYLLAAVTVGGSAAALIQANLVDHQMWVSERTQYIALGGALVGLLCLMVCYSFGTNKDGCLVAATAAATAATCAMGMDLLAYTAVGVSEWGTFNFLKLFCLFMAMVALGLTTVLAATAWGNKHHAGKLR